MAAAFGEQIAVPAAGCESRSHPAANLPSEPFAMAVHRCPECGLENSDDMPVCTRCGHTLKPQAASTRGMLLNAYNIGCLILLAVLTGGFVYWLVGILT
jgi:uncharacterized paraquat-inducible protein A